MNEKLTEALGYVDEKYVTKAARRKKKKKVFLGLIAAVLALVLLTNAPTVPFIVTARAVALAADSRIPERPIKNGLISDEKFDTLYDAWWAADNRYGTAAEKAVTDMRGFFQKSSAQFLTGEENVLWSPVNAAIALSIVAETASGTTRQEVLELLGVDDVETLRSYVSGLWEMCYQDDGKEISVLANSLWLDSNMKYDQSIMDTLANDYHASVYQGNLGSPLTNHAIQTWVNNQTGGFLNQMSNGIDVTPNQPDVDTALALASTIYIQAQWNDHDKFDAGNNTVGPFHSPGGTVEAEYMNKHEMEDTYYWGESYGAVRLSMKNDTSMWLILPDEGKTAADVLATGEYLEMFQDYWEYENSKRMKINLSVPKFDVSASLDLKEGLMELGMLEAFLEHADFGTTFETDEPVFVNRVNQATRVAIDEEGVTAASYLILDWGVGAMPPPDEVIDFVLDRPFIFAITGSGGIPMFMGVVNEP